MDEGKARIEVHGEGDKDDGVFYNPRMEMNRDITIAVLRAWEAESDREDWTFTYADAMGASGIRGVRTALETDLEVTV
ncbi:MAG: hypothetical protein SXQ77_04695, partial [Halobacteria archaeon]|nr:hypothetical protein [Halobacteria archaeon]